MQMNLNTDDAIRVLLGLTNAGYSVAVNGVNERGNSPIICVDCVISKLVESKLLCFRPDDPDQHQLIIAPDKVTLKCINPDTNDVIQIDFSHDDNPNMSLSNILFSALNKSRKMKY